MRVPCDSPDLASVHVQPEVCAVAEHPRQHQGGIDGDRTAIVAQFVDVLTRYAHGLRKVALREAKRLQELGDQDFACTGRLALRHEHGQRWSTPNFGECPVHT
jgi:hypothetical protein